MGNLQCSVMSISRCKMYWIPKQSLFSSFTAFLFLKQICESHWKFWIVMRLDDLNNDTASNKIQVERHFCYMLLSSNFSFFFFLEQYADCAGWLTACFEWFLVSNEAHPDDVISVTRVARFPAQRHLKDLKLAQSSSVGKGRLLPQPLHVKQGHNFLCTDHQHHNPPLPFTILAIYILS